MAHFTLNDIPDLSGKRAVVTGATGGLGLETALGLAGAGAEVILSGRNAGKGEAALASVRARHPNANVRFETLDLASLLSIANFSGALSTAAQPIDILIDNAGVMALPHRQVTVDGFEMQFGTNYLGHFALVGRLLSLLIAGPERDLGARVVQLASIAHRGGRIAFDDLNHAQRYRAWPVYQQSKLAMLMFAIELQRRSDANGWGLTSVAAHPGFARTDLIANGPLQGGGGGPMMALGKLFEPLVSHDAAAGALPTLLAATQAGVLPGGYYGPQGFMELRGPPGHAKIERQASVVADATRLWSLSESLTGVRFG
ncbi:SDR family oxidoreductase [soil metagenome]